MGRNVKKAVIASEDQNFYRHNGFDFQAIQKAFADNQKGKKLKEPTLRDLITTKSNLSFQEQHTGLKKYLAEWKGNLEQVDDICIIGIKF